MDTITECNLKVKTLSLFSVKDTFYRNEIDNIIVFIGLNNIGYFSDFTIKFGVKPLTDGYYKFKIVSKDRIKLEASEISLSGIIDIHPRHPFPTASFTKSLGNDSNPVFSTVRV